LSLAAGEVLPAFAHLQFVTLRMQSGKFMHAGQFCGLQHHFVVHVACARDEVVAQGAGQQLDVLGHVADVVAQFADIDLANVHAIDQQRARIRLVKTDQQFGQRAFARAAAPDDADLLARPHIQVDAAQRQVLLVRVGEVDFAERHRALQRLAAERAFVVVAFLRQLHHLVDRDHRHLGLLVARQQPRQLRQRAQCAAAEHVAGNEAAHAEGAINDLVHAENDHRHASYLLDQQGDVHGQAGQHLDPQFQAAEGANGLFPLILALAFCVIDLDRIEPGEGFDQARLALGAQGHGALQCRSQRFLEHVADTQGQREGDDRNPHQVAAEHGDHHQDDQGEGQVDQAREGQRGEEVAHPLEFMDVLRKAADPRRAHFHGHAHDALEQRRGDDQVGFFARQVQA